MHIEVRLPATASTVFDAWVVPEVMQRWLFVGPSNRILEVTSELNAEEIWRGMLSGLQRVLLGKPAIGRNGA
jgi:uncharacterized protein YndB with AHSA1/START domain